MIFNLFTIDWTAIGSIVTLMALIVAYWNIRQSDKQNKANTELQILLLKHGVEQNRLDELIESILIIYTPMNPIMVVDYTIKFTRSFFTEDDRHFIDEMASKDEYCNNLMRVRLIKYGNRESAKKILMELMSIRKVFGEWIQILGKLNISKQEGMYVPDDLLNDISTMNKRIKEIIPHFHVPVLPLTNTEHLLVKHLAVGYHYPVLSDIDFSIKGGQKVVITGFNGIGKSTLLKTLIGQIPSMQGHFKFSDQVTFGYFEQDLIWDEPEQTPIQIVSNVHPDMVIKDVRKHLVRCGISSKHAMQAIGTLSGGEQAKVKMCLLTLIPCNFLIMDEPTNHLDVQAKEALKSALMDFAGTVLLVSHEEAFYREWAQRVISVEK